MRLKASPALKGLSPHDALKHRFTSLRLNFPTTKGFRTKISIKLFYQNMAIFFNFQVHQVIFIHYSNSRLVVYEDDNVKSGLKRLNRSY